MNAKQQDECELRGITNEQDHPDLIKVDCKGCGYWYFKADLIDGYCYDCDSIRENK